MSAVGGSGSPAAVIFDLDGTVWHSAPGMLHSFAHTLRHFGVTIPPDHVLMAQLGPPLMAALADLGIPGPDLDSARSVYRAEYRAVGELMCEPYPGIVELIDDLRGRGVRLATATSKGVEPARRMLDHFDLTRRFDVVAAATMTASSHSKVEVIADALDGLGRPDAVTVMMIGDRRFDVEGGRHFGLRTTGVRWGYATDGELEAVAPQHLVDTVDQLAALLA